MVSRRKFLGEAAGAVAAAVVARGGTSAVQKRLPKPGALPANAEEAGPFRVIAPGVGMDGFYPEVRLSQTSPFQGGALFVSATNAVAGTAHVFGRDYMLAQDEFGLLGGFVGFGTEDPPGPTTMTVHLTDTLNEPLNYGYELSIRKTEWTFDSIIIPPPPPPDPNAPPPPPAPPNEQPRLNELYATVTQRMWHGPWILPLILGGDIWISGYFGEERSFNGGPRGGHHGGTDIAAPAGSQIQATNRGTVVFAQEGLTRGNCTVIDHGAGILSCYGHQSAIRVSVGDEVERGDVIGLVGSTGLSTGPHLHWELSVGGVLVDGLRWLDGTQGF